MRKQPICGYLAKAVDNSNGSFFKISFTIIYGVIYKIVTKTENLALVQLMLVTIFRRYGSIIGYIIVENSKVCFV